MDTLNPGASAVPLQADERAALRAYLQRTEVRLSTLHRVAGLFVSGAGLLALIPTVFQNGILGLLETNVVYLVKSWRYFLDSPQTALGFLRPMLWAGEIAIFIAILSIPIYAIYNLIKDLVLFYFDSNVPEYHLTVPRFSIPALALSPDELNDNKQSVFMAQYRGIYSTPHIEGETNFKDILLRSSVSGIIDRMTQSSEGQTRPLKECEPVTRETRWMESSLGFDKVSGQDNASSQLDKDIQRLNIAFDIAGLLDLDLRDDVARTEILMTKKNVLLRSLVLRYFKALITILITTIGLMVGGRLTQLPSIIANQPFSSLDGGQVTLLLLNLSLLCILALLYNAVGAPIKWIYTQSNAQLDKADIRLDSKISHFERYTRSVCTTFGILAILILIALFTVY